MKFFTLFLSVAFVAASFEAVNGKLTAEQQHGKTSSTTIPAVKPTSAPLMTSTLAPTKSPKVQVSPTKSVTLNKTSTKPHLLTTKKTHTKLADKKEEVKPTEKSVMVKEMPEVLPIQKPATVDHPLQAEESKPLAVTGFITRNGDIYEIETKNGTGIGKIQSRQAEDEGQHICNYGAVVIYSDVPCEQVTNVKVSELEDKPALDQQPAKQENKPAENDNKDKDDKESEDKEDLDTQKKPARRRVNSKRRNKNKKNKAQQQKSQKRRRNGQNRPNNKNNRRRVQQQQQKRRRQQQNNRRDWEEYDDDVEYDDERQYQNKRRRYNKRKGQRRQPERFTSDYDDDY